MITYEQAKNIIIAEGQSYSLKTQAIATPDICGHVCAKDLDAPISVQPFDNSAMDGFAVFSSDLVDAKEDNPVTLSRIMVIAAGDSVPDIDVTADQCVQIMTGAPLPKGVDSVIPIELVSSIDGDNITFTQKPRQGAHIRKAGEDFQKGQNVLKKGDLIEAQHIMALATLGIDKVEVYRKPNIAFLATGKELVDDLSQDLQSGQIYNSNAPYACAALDAMNVACKECTTIPDNQQAFEEKLKTLMIQDIDIVISSGAVSAGEFDFVKAGLENIGAKILFHKVYVRPGKPVLFARLPNGSLYFGLPGNPAASSVSLRFFVNHALRAMRSQEEEKPSYAKLMTAFSKKKDFRIFLKAKTDSWDDGFLTVDLFAGQASFMVNPFLKMNCWAVAPEGIEELKAGDVIEIFPL